MRRRSSSRRCTDDADITRAAGIAARGLTDGTLTLRQIVGLTDAEMAAIAQAAQVHRRAGRLQEAAAIYGLLIAHDPLSSEPWRQLAGLLQRAGQHAAAVACFEVVALLVGRDAEATACEMRALGMLGHADLASELQRVIEDPQTEELRGR